MSDELIGQVIDGRFEVRAKLGQGGMGAVYRAWQKSVDREVAIKVIHRAFTKDPMAATRFEREARLASKLSQPNTVSVLDFGTTGDGRLFLAMELIKGRTLHELLVKGGPFALDRVVRVGTQICDALEAAHALGIIHRDLKLENVIVLDDPPGRDLVKVLDFGLAKLEGDVRGTAAGVVVGTPRYMAPEVTTSGSAVTASDMYAVGVILAELATGTSPWQGDSLGSLLQHKLEPSPVLARMPPPLRALVGSLLDPNPERRPTAARTREWLGAIARGDAPVTPMEAATVSGKVSARPQIAVNAYPPPRRSRTPWLVGGAVVIAAIVTGGVVSSRQGGTPASADAPRATATQPGPADPWSLAPGVQLPEIQLGGHGHTLEVGGTPAQAGDRVKVHVTSSPEGASYVVNGGGMLGTAETPHDMTLPRSTTPLEFRFWISGTGTQTIKIVPDHDQDVHADFGGEGDCSERLVDAKSAPCIMQFCTKHPEAPACRAQ